MLAGAVAMAACGGEAAPSTPAAAAGRGGRGAQNAQTVPVTAAPVGVSQESFFKRLSSRVKFWVAPPKP